MGKQIVRVTSNKKEAQKIAKQINVSMKKRKIKREAFVSPISQSYVRTLTRKGYPIPKRNYGVCMRDKK